MHSDNKSMLKVCKTCVLGYVHSTAVS